jgi:glycerophosphoryl diester phosphodiesterase
MRNYSLFLTLFLCGMTAVVAAAERHDAVLSEQSDKARAAVTSNDAEGFLRNGVTAHRGNSGEHPECTMPAFASGIAVGADWLELDILRTKDGKLVVIHDRTTGRVGDRNLEVMKSTYAELSRIDVATDFRQRHGKSKVEYPSERIPLLADVLKLVMKQQKTRVSIQPKMDCVADAIELIHRIGAQKWVGFNDGNLKYMSDVKRLAPAIPVFWDRGNSDLSKDLIIARERGFEALVLNDRVVTAEKVALIHQAGFEAGVWTVNNENDLKRFLKMGVDRIYTDYPTRLLELKNSIKSKTP